MPDVSTQKKFLTCPACLGDLKPFPYIDEYYCNHCMNRLSLAAGRIVIESKCVNGCITPKACELCEMNWKIQQKLEKSIEYRAATELLKTETTKLKDVLETVNDDLPKRRGDTWIEKDEELSQKVGEQIQKLRDAFGSWEAVDMYRKALEQRLIKDI